MPLPQGRDIMRSTVMTRNGRVPVLGDGSELPDLSGEARSGTPKRSSSSRTFLVL